MRRQQACNWLAHQIDPSLFRALQSPLFSIDKTGSFCVPAAAVQQQPGAARVTALSSQDASYIGAGRATGVFQYQYSVMHSCLVYFWFSGVWTLLQQMCDMLCWPSAILISSLQTMPWLRISDAELPAPAAFFWRLGELLQAALCNQTQLGEPLLLEPLCWANTLHRNTDKTNVIKCNCWTETYIQIMCYGVQCCIHHRSED